MIKKRIMASIDEDICDYIYANYKVHKNTMSQFIEQMLRDYKTRDEKTRGVSKQPETDEEKLLAIVDQMGRLNEENQVKFDAIKSILPESLEDPSKESQIKPFVDAIWRMIVAHNGSIEFHRKIVAISHDDLQKYEELNRLYLEKEQLEARLMSSASTSSV